jgi:hypothetical protein
MRHNWGEDRVGQVKPNADFIRSLLAKPYVLVDHRVVVINDSASVSKPESLDVRSNGILAQPRHTKPTKDMAPACGEALLSQQRMNDAISNVRRVKWVTVSARENQA